MAERPLKYLLLVSVFAIATCGLVYELISGTLASYLLGDSVTQFSTVIGVYLFAMGIGSYLSRHIHRNEVGVFVQVELLVGLVGGCSAALLFVLFEHVASFRVLLYGLVLVIGLLVGVEIPLLLRILKDRLEFKELVAQVFTFDYIGALLASLLFPLVLVPHLGLVRSGFLFGSLNTVVALVMLHWLRKEAGWARPLAACGWLILAGLLAGLVYSDRILQWSEQSLYPDRVIHARTTPYQRIVLTRSGDDLRLYLNGNLQFSSRDEYRYHEALVHPVLSRLAAPSDILILGGGDGLAARETLRYRSVTNIVLVDLDAAMTRLFARHEILTRLNGGALTSPRVHVVNQDAFTWLKTNTLRFDGAIVDFPDPSNFSLGKLYTTTFYGWLAQALKPGGAIVVQATSPYVARRSFWCVDATLRASGFQTEPYHLYVPSFGEWGFLAAFRAAPEQPYVLPEGLQFLNPATLQTLYQFPPDMDRVPTAANRLNNQILVRLFEEEWAHYVH